MVALEITFLGGVHEIGRVSIAVRTQRTQILMDSGVMMGRPPKFPMHIPPKDVDALILTHCHLDHSGAVPIFFIQDKKPFYATDLTLELTHLLLKDFIHLSGYYLPFEYLELDSMMQSSVNLKFREKTTIGDITVQLLDAGHVPGSSQILLEAEGKRILFTGDFNTSKSRLLPPADGNYGELDAVIMETTYADSEHPERRQLEKEFIAQILEIVEKGGTVLVPAFSIGRSQEIASILAAYHFEYQTTIDGMARAANQIMMKHVDFLRDSRLFIDAMHGANWVSGWRDRRAAAKQTGVIISPAGMLQGGPAAFYISKIGKNSNNAILLVSYQIPGTPGRELLEKGLCVVNGKQQKIKAQVTHFDFSSHCGVSQLRETVESLRGEPTVFAVHGGEGNCIRFIKWVRRKVGLKSIAPRAGDRFTI